MERYFGVIIYMLGFTMLVVTLVDALDIANLMDNDIWMALFMGVGYFLSIAGFLFNRRTSEEEETLMGVAIDDWMGLLMFGLGLGLILLSFFYALEFTDILLSWGPAGVPVFVTIGIVLCLTGFGIAGATMSSMVGRNTRKY